MLVLLRSTGSQCIVLSTRLTVVPLSNYSSFIVVVSCFHALRLARGDDSVFRVSLRVAGALVVRILRTPY